MGQLTIACYSLIDIKITPKITKHIPAIAVIVNVSLNIKADKRVTPAIDPDVRIGFATCSGSFVRTAA